MGPHVRSHQPLPCKKMDNRLPRVLRAHRSLGFAPEEITRHLEMWRLSSVRTNEHVFSSHEVVLFV